MHFASPGRRPLVVVTFFVPTDRGAAHRRSRTAAAQTRTAADLGSQKADRPKATPQSAYD